MEINRNLSERPCSTGFGKITSKNCLRDYFHLLKSQDFSLYVLRSAGSYSQVLLYSTRDEKKLQAGVLGEPDIDFTQVCKHGHASEVTKLQAKAIQGTNKETSNIDQLSTQNQSKFRKDVNKSLTHHRRLTLSSYLIIQIRPDHNQKDPPDKACPEYI